VFLFARLSKVNRLKKILVRPPVWTLYVTGEQEDLDVGQEEEDKGQGGGMEMLGPGG